MRFTFIFIIMCPNHRTVHDGSMYGVNSGLSGNNAIEICKIKTHYKCVTKNYALLKNYTYNVIMSP